VKWSQFSEQLSGWVKVYPGWHYAFGWSGDFMVLVGSGFSRAMVAFRD